MNTATREAHIKIYIAGSSQELGRCVRAIDFARSLGFNITYDWTKNVTTLIGQGVLEHELPFEQRESQALYCMQAIDDADVVVVLLPNRGAPSRGCWVELGYAIATRMHSPHAVAQDGAVGRPTIYLINGPFTADASLFETLAENVYAADDKLGLDQVATLMRPKEDA